MTTTMLVIFGSIVLLAVYDVYAYFRFGVPGTISLILYGLAQKYPVIAFVLGFVFGHIFWQVQICST